MDEYERQPIDVSLSLSLFLSLSLSLSLINEHILKQLKKKKVSPGDTGGQESRMKSGLPLAGSPTCSILCPEARHHPASCEDHSKSLLLVGRESGALLTMARQQTPEYFIWHMEGTECQRGFTAPDQIIR